MCDVLSLHFASQPRTAKQPIDLMRSLGPALDGDFYSAFAADFAPFLSIRMSATQQHGVLWSRPRLIDSSPFEREAQVAR